MIQFRPDCRNFWDELISSINNLTANQAMFGFRLSTGGRILFLRLIHEHEGILLFFCNLSNLLEFISSTLATLPNLKYQS